jgi:hypothetical protein
MLRRKRSSDCVPRRSEILPRRWQRAPLVIARLCVPIANGADADRPGLPSDGCSRAVTFFEFSADVRWPGRSFLARAGGIAPVSRCEGRRVCTYDSGCACGQEKRARDFPRNGEWTVKFPQFARRRQCVTGRWRALFQANACEAESIQFSLDNPWAFF